MEESWAEGVVRQRLSALDDRWHVIHHLAWRRPAPGHYQLGEGDFVLVHPDRGVLVLEVKGGQVAHHDGVWTTTPMGGEPQEIEDPMLQADRTVRAMKQKLQCGLVASKLRVRGAVVLPAVRVDGDLSPNVPRSLVVDAVDLGDVVRALERVCDVLGMNVAFSDEEAAGVAELLSPTVTTTIHLRVAAEAVHARVLDLTEGQAAVLDLLDLQLRANISGGSGTGKTVLAVEKARRLAQSGERVLLTCFNRMLADHLRTQVADEPSIFVDNYHGLAWDLVDRAGLGRPSRPTQEWWDITAPALLPRAGRKAGLNVDSLLVDEAQDFSEAWLTSLEALLDDPSTAHVYTFADPEQNLFERSAALQPLERTFRLTRNLRCTEQIAVRLDALWGIAGAHRGPTGPEPILRTADRPDDQVHLLRNEVYRLVVKGGLRPDQIVILTSGTATLDRVLALGSLLELPLWRAPQGVADTRAGERPAGALQLDTVHRFKGLEADAVILLLDEVETLRERRIAYVGMGRATSVLIVIGPEQLRAALNWP
jgi:hypothetical protein